MNQLILCPLTGDAIHLMLQLQGKVQVDELADCCVVGMSLKRNRPVKAALTERYSSGGKPYGGFDCSDVPGQELVDAIDRMVGDTLQDEAKVG